MADTTYWLDQFERNANWPLTWRLVANDLLMAADVLLSGYREAQSKKLRVGRPVSKGFHLLSPALLLRAAALEALLKGRAVSRGHRFVVNGNFCPIPRTGKGHDLVLLADATGFSLNGSERDLLCRLSPHLELARYPIGKSWQTGLKKHSQPGIGYVVSPSYTSSDDLIFTRLVKRLRCAIQSKRGRRRDDSNSKV
jgi:hypothetical protein